MIKKRSVGLKFVAFLIGFFLTWVLIVFAIYAGITRALDGNYIRKSINKLNIADIELDGDTISDKLYEYVIDENGIIVEGKTISREDISDFLDIKAVKSFAADKLADTVDCMIEGEGKVTINGEEIADIVEDSADDIYDIIGVSISAQDIEKIRMAFDGEEKVIIDADEIYEDSDNDSDTKLVREFVGGKYKIYFLISIIILIGMLVAINFKNYRMHILSDLAFPMIISGIMTALFTAAVPIVIEQINSGDASEMGLINGILDYVMDSVSFYAYAMIIIGALALGFFFALKYIDKSKYMKSDFQ